MAVLNNQNPRRRPSSSETAIASLSSTSKAATFHQGRSPASPADPALSISSLIHRAPTSTKDELEALVDANEGRVQEFLTSIEDSLRGLQKITLNDDKVQAAETHAKLRNHFALPARIAQKADSGIGSSGSSETEHDKATLKEASKTGAKEPTMGSKALDEQDTARVLSEYACKQIQKHIINPILAQEQLKPFHPLVKYLPFRIAEKKITTLRDLEKVIFWLAPVRQFAQMISRQRDATSGKQLQLTGGLGRTGKSAELTYTKDGKTFSLRTGEEVDPDELPLLKRSVDDEIDDDVERSMARRKKNAPPEKIVHKCFDCAKEFKRPCDLTKHEKTHSRPWKCHEKGCKYFEYGWPTEKERDRHFNDKHSNDPKMFRCNYPPCPYESKRESNCKQHMEKAHGWQYSRTKSNGKAPKRPSFPGQAPPTPAMSNMSTPGSHIFTAPSPAYTAASPATMGSDTPLLDFAQPPMYPQGPQQVSSDFEAVQNQMPPVPQFDFGHTFGPLNNQFQFNQEDPLDLNNLNFDAAGSPESWASAFGGTDTEMRDEESIFGTNFDWAHQDLTSMNMQVLSPNTVSDGSIATPAQLPEFSPANHKTMLPTPLSQYLDSPAEDGFADFAQMSKDMDTGADFALFGKSEGFDANSNAPLFGDISGDHSFTHLNM